HRILVVDLVAAAGEQARLVDLDDVADALHQPLDAALAARLALLVVDGGDEHVLRADGVGRLDGADFEAAGVRVAVAEVAEAGWLGVRADDVAARQQAGEVTRVLGDAEAAGGRDGQDCRQQRQAPALERLRHFLSPPPARGALRSRPASVYTRRPKR